MRTLPAVLPDVIDELTYAVPDYIPANEDGNTSPLLMPCALRSDRVIYRLGFNARHEDHAEYRRTG